MYDQSLFQMDPPPQIRLFLVSAQQSAPVVPGRTILFIVPSANQLFAS